MTEKGREKLGTTGQPLRPTRVSRWEEGFTGARTGASCLALHHIHLPGQGGLPSCEESRESWVAGIGLPAKMGRFLSMFRESQTFHNSWFLPGLHRLTTHKKMYYIYRNSGDVLRPHCECWMKNHCSAVSTRPFSHWASLTYSLST